MKTLATSLGAVVLALSLNACSFSFLKEKYTRNEAAASGYLSSKKTGSARTNVEGLWYSPQWNIVVLNQEGSKVSGIFQDYYKVNGLVSGRNVYLVLRDDDWAEYTVELKKQPNGDLKGFYSPDVPFSEATAHELVLKRIDY